jgi:hypothetical protein
MALTNNSMNQTVASEQYLQGVEVSTFTAPLILLETGKFFLVSNYERKMS